jgi:CheY-like chemotaxis protein
MPFSVLYIEDDMQQIEIVRMFLAREQVGFIAARDGVSGLAAVREHHPSLVFIDINLPMMNGLEVAATLREDPEFASLPLVALTSTMKFTHQTVNIGELFDAYLSKPVMRADIVKCVHSFMAQTSP